MSDPRNVTAQDNRNLAMQLGKEAANDYLRGQQNPNSSESQQTANRLANQTFRQEFERLEGERKQGITTNKPVVIIDPMNRLFNPTRIDTPAPDYSGILNMSSQYPVPVVSNLSARGPITTPSVLPAHVQTLNAFMAYIAGLDQQGLLDLKAHLFSYRDALKTQPATAARNVKIREAELQISKINQKLPESVRYGSSSVVTTPVPAQTLQPQGPSVEYDSCLAMQAKGARIMCKPSGGSVTPRPLPKPQPQSTGTTVSTMPLVDTGNEGVRAELNAPILDLYSVYADRGYEREAAAIKEETARMLDDINQQQEYRASVPQVSSVAPVTSLPSQQQLVVATETDYSLQPMPTMPSPVETISLEEAATGQVSSGPVAMSASAENVPEAVNWWLLGGLGIVALVFFGGKAKRGTK